MYYKFLTFFFLHQDHHIQVGEAATWKACHNPIYYTTIEEKLFFLTSL